ncbi:glycosyltransferase family 4 protein [Chamaesiphon sp.]|uniref:glycosyltransferase family 4 protein n=1 Tax=Chamaesiphon sp. TaxID=2814140 RepID=UPI003593A4D5
MKILHVSSFDLSGGAARSAYRIHRGLQEAGITSQMLVQFKSVTDQSVTTSEGKLLARVRSFCNDLTLSNHSQSMFSSQWFPDAVASKVDGIDPDIVNINWICNGYLQIETLSKLKRPLIFTLQDMWSFTGGCHYSLGCDRYTISCGNCPQLQSHREADLSRSVWHRKAKSWKNLDLTVVAPSEWMATCARASSLFRDVRVEVIPFGLDTSVFKPIDPRIARELLNLPQAKQLVLFGAIDATGDTRKGFHLLQQALHHLLEKGWGDRIELVVFGASKPDKPLDLGFPVHYLGKLQDDLSLQIAYAAADVMIAPSIEEAFGQTASESLACGTPVVVFANTGLADIVDCHQNGYVAKYCDTADLARGIAWVLENSERHQRLRQAAREKAVREYAMQVQAHRYLSLFHKILDSSQPIAGWSHS